MDFSRLSIDALRAITSYLHYLDIANLWFTGCKALGKKFESGAVAEWNVFFSSNLRPLFWPSFFTLARVSRLSLNDTHESPVITTKILENFPNTLKELELNCAGAFPALQDLLRRSWSLPLLDTLELTVYRAEVPEKGIMTLWPASLRSLILMHPSQRHLNLELASLPPNLTTLSGDFCKIVTEPSGAFPKSLTSMRFSLSRLTGDSLPSLPASLETFNIAVWPQSDAEDDVQAPTESEIETWLDRSVCKLPRGLTSLRWPKKKDWSREELQQLPSSLTILSGVHMQAANFDVLPPHLEYCSFFTFYMLPVTQSLFQARLPSALKHLHVEADVLPLLKPTSAIRALDVFFSIAFNPLQFDATQLPPLTALTLEKNVQLPWGKLPKTLTSLMLKRQSLDALETQSLPRALKYLSLSSGDLLEEAWPCLPPTLESLSIGSSGPLSASSSSWLPKTLQNFSVSMCESVPLEWFEGLPTTLRVLHIPLGDSTFATVTSPSWRIAFPESLTRVSFGVDFPTDSEEAATAVLRNILASLPRQMQDLSIFDRTGEVPITLSSEELLQLLPSRLVNLDIPLSKAPDRRSLPRSLHYYSMPYNET